MLKSSKFSICLLIIFTILINVSFVMAFGYGPPETMPPDTLPIPQPETVKIDVIHDQYSQTITLRFEKLLDIAAHLRSLTGHEKQAMNVNAFDGVDNSSWFTNRNIAEKMSVEAFAKGPDKGHGPDMSDGWTITRAKMEGITPGFTIKDSKGEYYVIKFDPPGYSELATGAEVAVTKLFYGMGFNVPENYIAVFDPAILKLGENVTFVDEKGRRRNMTEADIKNILTRVEFLPNGNIRALASKYVEGRPIGGFRYEKTRKDDPNDIYPHEHRRELRGLEVPCSWLKHFDSKAGNNLDTYVGKDGQGYVKHYLIDFGSTLGSAAFAPQDPYKGHEYDIDFMAMGQNAITLGFLVRDWEKLPAPSNPVIGTFDSWDFDPADTRPLYPNPAFVNCTNLDGYWGAKLVMSITDEQLMAAIKTGKYTKPEDEQYIFKILKERRDKSGLYWYNQVCPLDFFQLENDTQDMQLSFTDMGVKDGLWKQDQSFYRYSIIANGQKIVEKKGTGEASVPLSGYVADIKKTLQEHPLKDGSNQVCIRLKNSNPQVEYDKAVDVYIECGPDFDNPVLLGIDREN